MEEVQRRWELLSPASIKVMWGWVGKPDRGQLLTRRNNQLWASPCAQSPWRTTEGRFTPQKLVSTTNQGPLVSAKPVVKHLAACHQGHDNDFFCPLSSRWLMHFKANHFSSLHLWEESYMLLREAVRSKENIQKEVLWASSMKSFIFFILWPQETNTWRDSMTFSESCNNQ